MVVCSSFPTSAERMGDGSAPAWVLPPVLHPHHESHGRDHDAFSVAIGAGHSRRPAFALTPYPTLLRSVGEFLSNAAGALLLLPSPSRRHVSNHASLLPSCVPFPFPTATKNQLETFLRAANGKGSAILTRSFADLFCLRRLDFCGCGITGR